VAESNELDGVFLPLAAAYVGAGVLAWLVGYGYKPLLVSILSLFGVRQVFNNLEDHGTPIPRSGVR
jgi:hypothetical protein